MLCEHKNNLIYLGLLVFEVKFSAGLKPCTDKHFDLKALLIDRQR
jgi:hypothetical protein